MLMTGHAVKLAKSRKRLCSDQSQLKFNCPASGRSNLFMRVCPFRSTPRFLFFNRGAKGELGPGTELNLDGRKSSLFVEFAPDSARRKASLHKSMRSQPLGGTAKT